MPFTVALPVLRAKPRVIANGAICGDELVSAVAFLADALDLPALQPDRDRTAKVINVAALRRAAAAA